MSTDPRTPATPSVEEQLHRLEDAAEYAAAQALRDIQDHRDDAHLVTYTRTGGAS
ncbi:hypothetical protein [Streptomyces sp. NPDC017529]|uniref:hypothetical protein n=1 Tax=Streptomyces sp. NPDC017529 TaxID=3365000 RepID=UPI0037A98EB4